MPRPDRPRVANGLYHVYAHGVDGRTIFRDDWDYVALLGGLEQVYQRHRWSILAFCVVPTHYHLLVKTPNPDLPDGMWRLNLGYARWFNKRYRMKGHVFDRRYGATLVTRNPHFLHLVRYIA